MKTLILTLTLAVFFPYQAFADRTELIKVENYFENLNTLQATFKQSYVDENNELRVLTGDFYLDRPGRMRFEFNEIDDFIVADGFFVYFYDGQEKQQSNAPIGQTLADFILRKNLDFEDEIKMSDLKKSNGYTYMTLTQKSDPTVGRIQLMFSDIPYELKKWRIIDSQGTAVDIELDNVKKNVKFTQGGLFMYRDPNAQIGQLNE